MSKRVECKADKHRIAVCCNSRVERRKRVPILVHLPLIGSLFETPRPAQRIELLIMVTPESSTEMEASRSTTVDRV